MSGADATVATLRCAVADAFDAIVHAAEPGGQAAMARAQTQLASVVAQLRASPQADDERVAAMLKDVVQKAGTVEGRVRKSLEGEDRYKRWGRHFIRALCRAYEVQQCTNQQDFGLQAYGGALFKALRTRGAALFLALPPPTPAIPRCVLV